jgi:hypothetical protein
MEEWWKASAVRVEVEVDPHRFSVSLPDHRQYISREQERSAKTANRSIYRKFCWYITYDLPQTIQLAIMNSKNEGTSALAGFWGASYFPALDGLRAICILLVIFNHTRCHYPPFIYGWVGVDIFFVLSGFLITTLLLRERESYGNLSLKGFYTRRAFRILPVYFVVLAGYLVLIPLLRDWKRWEEMKLALPYLLTFTQEFRPAATGNIYNQTWSLGYEEKFYLLWPLLVLIGFPFRTRRIGILIAAASLILLLPPTGARSYGGLFLGALFGVVLDKSSGR